MRLLKNAATIVLMGCAILVTVAVVKREFLAPNLTSPAAEIEDWQSLAASGHRAGPEEAPVVVIEFADFQCPFCATAAKTLRQIRDLYEDDVAVVYRHFPLTALHPHAWDAAIAAECAAAEGRFFEFHDVLFEDQESIGVRLWTDYAREAGINATADFVACLDEQWARDRVSEDARVAREIRLAGTPAVFVNGLHLTGTPSREALIRHIDRLLGEARAR